jgi:hypothetical protein
MVGAWRRRSCPIAQGPSSAFKGPQRSVTPRYKRGFRNMASGGDVQAPAFDLDRLDTLLWPLVVRPREC